MSRASLGSSVLEIRSDLPGFMPGIHVLISLAALKTWMAGTTGSPPTKSAGCPDPAMTNGRCGHHRSLCEPALCASDPAEQVDEFFPDLRSQLGTRAGNHGKIRKPLERPTGIDDGAGIGRARLVEQGIKWPAPGAAHELDVACGVAARAHGPHYVEQVARIDIIVDDHHEAPEIGGRLATGRQQGGLARVAGIGLFDSDDVEHARTAEFVHPHAGNAG